MKRIALLALALVIAPGSAVPGGEKEPDYRKLVNRGYKRLREAKTCQADITYSVTSGGSTRGTVYLQRPRLIHFEWTYTENGVTDTFLQRDDGVRGVQMHDGRVTMDMENREVIDRTIRTSWDRNLLCAFFKGDRLIPNHLPKGAPCQLFGPLEIGNTDCDTVIVDRDDYQMFMVMVAPDGLVRGYNCVGKDEHAPMYEARLTRVVLNEPIPERILNWKPPARILPPAPAK